jgi:hypothetical protein
VRCATSESSPNSRHAVKMRSILWRWRNGQRGFEPGDRGWTIQDLDRPLEVIWVRQFFGSWTKSLTRQFKKRPASRSELRFTVFAFSSMSHWLSNEQKIERLIFLQSALEPMASLGSLARYIDIRQRTDTCTFIIPHLTIWTFQSRRSKIVVSASLFLTLYSVTSFFFTI